MITSGFLPLWIIRKLLAHATVPVLLFAFISLTVSAQAPGVVKHISELPDNIPQHFIPDVMGKVLIAEDYFDDLTKQINGGGAVVFPGWPVSVSGESRRGGLVCNMDSDQELEVVYCAGNKVYAWKTDGSLVPGWPVTLQMYPDGPPALGDVTGDGHEELVVSTRMQGTGNEGILYVFRKDGSHLPGFPVIMLGGAMNAPVLADIDSDGVLDIILAERVYPKGYVSVYKGDGTIADNWPQTLNHVPASAVAAGDITGDSVPEIVAVSYTTIYVFDNMGQILPGFPYTPGNTRVFSYSSPVLADLDQDGFREIIVGDHSEEYGYGLVHVLRNDGTLFPGWPTNTANWIFAPLSVADIDYDGSLDIISGDQMISPVPWCHVYAWNKHGQFLEGFPTWYIYSIHNQVMILDLDDDKYLELVCDDNTADGKYLAYNHDGTPLDGWPVNLTGTTFYINPVFADVNNDGWLDFTGGGLQTSPSQCNLYLWSLGVPYKPSKSFLSVFQYNNKRDGVYAVPEGFLFASFSSDTTTIAPGEQIHFSDRSLGDISLREWVFQGGIPSVSNDLNPIVTYLLPGKYDVELAVFMDTYADTVHRIQYISVSEPTGITRQIPPEPVLKVSPNPSAGSFVVQCDTFIGKKTRIAIRNVSGQLILEEIMVPQTNAVYVDLLPEIHGRGLFFLRVENISVSYTGKIVVY